MTNPTPQRTDFSLDITGRYVCNGLDEYYSSIDTSKRPDARPADMIVIGGGTFGAVLAARLFRRDVTHQHRILVLEAGPVSIPEHFQNLPLINPGEVWAVPWDSHSPQTWNQTFPGLAFTLGGRSLFWGGWSPYFIESELPSPPWPQSVVNDLTKTVGQSEAYLDQAARQIGTAATNDFVNARLHELLRSRLFDGLKSRPAGQKTALLGNRGTPMTAPGKSRADLETELEAPLAVESVASRPGFFPFNKFSSQPLLIRAARIASDESGLDDGRKRLMVVPHTHVIRLEMVGRRVVRVHTNQGAIDVPNGGRVFLALGTIESTRMALNAFPNHPLIGKNLMAHLRSNLTIRIPRTSFNQALDPNLHPDLKELAVSALFVKGKHTHPDNSVGHFHLQITASGVGAAEKNSEAELFKKIPDIDTLDAFRKVTDDWIVITLRGIGEMVGRVGDAASHEPRNQVILDGNRGAFDYEASRVSVSLEASLKDLALWTAMDGASDEVARIFAGTGPIQYLSLPNNAAKAIWQNQPPTTDHRRDTLSSTHHEGGTLWMGIPGQSVTDDMGRFHDADNLYAIGPALLPTLGSPNPMLSGVALARRMGDRLIPPPAIPALEPGFKHLFDGTESTFKRWQTAGRGSFALVDGAIVTYPGDDIGLFFYTEAFGDFVLKLEFRLASLEDNSGIFIRSRDPRFPVPRRGDLTKSDAYDNGAFVAVDTGFEVQIDELARGNKSKVPPEADGMDKKRTGALYDIPTTPGSFQQQFQRGPVVSPGQWNTYEIRVQKSPGGDGYTVLLNGQQTTTYTNTDGYRGKSAGLDPASGFIGLQSHSGRVAFRNIRVKA